MKPVQPTRPRPARHTITAAELSEGMTITGLFQGSQIFKVNITVATMGAPTAMGRVRFYTPDGVETIYDASQRLRVFHTVHWPETEPQEGVWQRLKALLSRFRR